jgi:hypothetical protein
VEYKKGKTHTLTDSLSRKPFTEEEKAQVEEIPPDADLAFLLSLTEDYLSDIQPPHVSILKLHSRHQRRHSKILHFAPLHCKTSQTCLCHETTSTNRRTKAVITMQRLQSSLHLSISCRQHRISHQLPCSRSKKTNISAKSLTSWHIKNCQQISKRHDE